MNVDEERTSWKFTSYPQSFWGSLSQDIGKWRYFQFSSDVSSVAFECIYCKRETSTEPKGFLWMQQESGWQSLLRPNLNSQGLVTCIAQKCMREKETRLQSLVRQYNCLKSSKPQGVNIRSCSCKVSDLEEHPVRDLGQAPSENKNHLTGYWKKHGWMGDTKILFWSKDEKPFIWFNGGSCRQTYHQGLGRF